MILTAKILLIVVSFFSIVMALFDEKEKDQRQFLAYIFLYSTSAFIILAVIA